ncbi:MAG TPA: Minf_1886 family protein [Verrucomicrobiae bacterium]
MVRKVLSNGAPVRETAVSEAGPDMQEINFDEAIEGILAKDTRYTREVYLFVREALDFTQKLVVKENRGQVRHVSGQELLNGIRQYALQQFGPMTVTLFEEWGVRNCHDFGEIVFNMVEANLLAKTDKDSRTDFQNGYDFTETFRKPFWPESKQKQEVKQVS